MIGLGYLGLVHASSLAKAGFDVVGVDIDKLRVTHLTAGNLPLYEPGLDALFEEVIGRRLLVTAEFAKVRGCDVHFLCVGTPEKVGGAADTSFVHSAVESLAPHLAAGDLVVGKSTVPVGTAQCVLSRLREYQPKVQLIWNPEFLREGLAILDTESPNRIIYGLEDETRLDDVARLDAVYAVQLSRGIPRLVVDFATAELVKVAANAFLATKISFINAMAEMCELAGANVVRLADAMGHDDRIGRKFLNAGIGFGGGCLPKDVRAFISRAGELGAIDTASLLRAVEAINLNSRGRMVDLTRAACGGSLTASRVAVLGAAFKPGSDDIRESPALEVAIMLHREGANVRVHDPKALRHARLEFRELTYIEDVLEACEDADVILHLTEWSEYAALDPHAVAHIARGRCIIDGRHTLDPQRWADAGWTYRSLGSGLLT